VFDVIMHRLFREATVVASRPLSPERRIAVERRARGREEAHRLKHADYAVVSYGKSGRTWLRVMLSRFYQVRHGLPERRLLAFDNLHRLNPAVPRVHITHDNYQRDYTGCGASKEDFRGTPVVLLVRHPADTAVSLYFQWRYRMARRKKALNGFPPHGADISVTDYVIHHPAGLQKVVAFLNEWAAALTDLDQVHVVRYEDLRSDPGPTMRKVLTFMGNDPTDAEIDEIVAYGSFENMKKLESKRAFWLSGSIMTPKDRANPNSYKVRRAKVGGYRDYFEDAEVAEIDAYIRANLDPVFGYVDRETGRNGSAPAAERASGEA
jgi:hypothetical protein